MAADAGRERSLTIRRAGTAGKDVRALEGRELDIAVAEKVVGLRVVTRDWPCGHGPECGEYEASPTREPFAGWFDTPDAVVAVPFEFRDSPEGEALLQGVLAMPSWELDGELIAPVPFYSRDARLAEVLMERMLREGALWLRILACPAGTCGGEPYLAEAAARFPDGANRIVSAGGRALAEAVCRLALRLADLGVIRGA